MKLPYSGPTNTSTTTSLYNLATVNVLRSGVVNPSGLACLNVIGSFAITLATAGLSQNRPLLIVATGGLGASLTLDNGGTILGLTTYIFKSGEVIAVQWDGTNLV